MSNDNVYDRYVFELYPDDKTYTRPVSLEFQFEEDVDFDDVVHMFKSIAYALGFNSNLIEEYIHERG